MKNTINWKIRFKNPVFWSQMILAVLTPIIAYLGLTFGDITTWMAFGQLITAAYGNPYLLGLVGISVYNAILDPTTSRFADSKQALTYEKPRDNKE